MSFCISATLFFVDSPSLCWLMSYLHHFFLQSKLLFISTHLLIDPLLWWASWLHVPINWFRKRTYSKIRQKNIYICISNNHFSSRLDKCVFAAVMLATSFPFVTIHFSLIQRHRYTWSLLRLLDAKRRHVYRRSKAYCDICKSLDSFYQCLVRKFVQWLGLVGLAVSFCKVLLR